MSLIADYNRAVSSGEIRSDEAQKQLIPYLQRVSDDLHQTPPRFFGLYQKDVKGLYLYGPVGVGKTYLMDLFYQYSGEPRKARFHFHHFMQQVDAQLRQLQGKKDPLRQIAVKIAKSTRLLCLDEFLVHDVAHAMILAELLQTLFSKGVVLVATANTRPDDLYLDGVHRGQFLPAIELLKQDCDVVSLEKISDYRLGRKPLPKAYLYPLNDASFHLLKEQFETLLEVKSEKITWNGALTVQHRTISCLAFCDGIVWFDFSVICNVPRCQLDYLELADRFHTLFLSNVPILTKDDTSKVILFIHLIDVLYDRGVRLILSAASSIDKLYIEGAMLSAFQRTMSRLQEMQSEDYLSRHQHHGAASF